MSSDEHILGIIGDTFVVRNLVIFRKKVVPQITCPPNNMLKLETYEKSLYFLIPVIMGKILGISSFVFLLIIEKFVSKCCQLLFTMFL